MNVENQSLSDIEIILSHRYDNGADYWTTPDKRLIKVLLSLLLIVYFIY